MTSIIKIIKTEQDHEEALKLIQELMAGDPDPNSEAGEKLSLLAALVEDYESRIFPESLPDPIDAILFRMEQQELKPADLIPYIGSRSKVSEVLARKRPLTISMIRSLESGLGIPAKILLKESDQFRDVEEVAWTRFPLREMEKRGYFAAKLSQTNDLNSLMKKFFQPVGSPQAFLGMLRKSSYRSLRPMDKQALVVWSAAVVKKTKKLQTKYRAGSIDLATMQKISKLSGEDNSPIRVQEDLATKGISLVIEPHFEHTYLDGATIMTDKEHPIIGLTLRLNRLDNFWFTLMHELAHISLHNNQSCNFYYDDLDNPNTLSKEEQQADELAQEALVPKSVWENSPAKLIPSAIAAESLAIELGIHPAIVAGKMRHEGGRYIYLTNIINQAKVRNYFPEEKWSK